MSYIRVIPRDLFNEGNLLKCLGALYIALETAGPHGAELQFEPTRPDTDFGIVMNDDGALSASNVELFINGKFYNHYRPLNSRASWPLYVVDFDDPDFDPVAVFNEATGTLSPEFVALIRRPAAAAA